MLTRHIRESLQVTPGPFPDFWVGPGDEVDGLNCSPAAESGDVVQSCSLGCCGTVSAKCQPQQNTPSTQQGLRVLQENLTSTLSLKVVDVTVYLRVSTSLCKCSTCIQ